MRKSSSAIMTAPTRPTKVVVTGVDGMRGGVVAATWC